MRTKRSTAMALGVLLALVLAGCPKQSALVTEYQAGLASKQLAETSYLAVYTAYRAGRVNEVDMNRARTAYATWAVAQREYVLALKDQRRGIDSKTIVLRHALTALATMAAQLGAL